jgi:curved DNA-binding protein CbpA
LSVERFQGVSARGADLAEEGVDLAAALREEILLLETRLAAADHWQVLGIPWNAPAAAVRDAYLDKVKRFHPDRYAGQRLGSYRARLERIFRRLTQARDVLADEAKRAAYARGTAPPEEVARADARRREDDRRTGERRARLARQTPLRSRAERAQELVERGKAALAQGKFAAAANDLLLAVGLEPRDAGLAALAAEARSKAAAVRANELFQKGLGAEAVGSWGPALARHREALEADPGHVRAASHGARAALALGDLGAARALAEAGVRCGPRAAFAHEALGLVLEAEGKKKEAKRALERAIELDPRLESAKQRLRRLRWSFLR